MMFCPKCGSLMAPKLDKGKKVLACTCGYTNKKNDVPSTMKEVVKAETEIISDVISDEPTSLPTTEEICPQCGHEEAWWWTKQMRASDEPETKFLKCTKCKHTWRDRS